MEEYEEKICRIYRKKLGYGRERVRVVDPETGELIAEEWTGNIETVFGRGANALKKTLCISREVAPSGKECIYITDDSAPKPYRIGRIWRDRNGHEKTEGVPKHTGGKPPYVKVQRKALQKAAQNLKDYDLGAFLRLAAYAHWRTGELKKGRKRLTFERLLQETGYKSRETLTRRLEALKKAGLIRSENGRFFICRDYVEA